MSQRGNLQSIPVVVEEPILQINVGNNKIHAKRISGRFRTFKWLTASLWLLYFLGPYLRWDGKQAVLFDIPGRQFHLFGTTIHPHDIWILSFVMIFFAMLLVVVTVLFGRAFCGYFCFQTVWTDFFTWIEECFEGSPKERMARDAAPWDFKKFAMKLNKHAVWLVISLLTGVSFAAWFTDAFQLWRDYFAFDAHISAWIVLLMFTIGTYLFAGFMREQVCFWLCPYARIQGVFYDNNTLLPTYDEVRGEPRAKLDRSIATQKVGCIDCNQCVVVCPTGIDIREGQQIGCITCGLCIDACDSVMDKIEQPRGLIRYGSQNEFRGHGSRKWLQRPQVILSAGLILISVGATAYGLNSITEAEFSVYPERQNLYVIMSDGSIQNSYQLRVFNKTDTDNTYKIRVYGIANTEMSGASSGQLFVKKGKMASTTVFVRAPAESMSQKRSPLIFRIVNATGKYPAIEYTSVFNSP